MIIQRPDKNSINELKDEIRNKKIKEERFSSLKEVCEVLNFQLSGFVYRNSYNVKDYGNKFLPEIVFKQKDKMIATLAARYDKDREVMETAIILYDFGKSKNKPTRVIFPLNSTNNINIEPSIFSESLNVYLRKYPSDDAESRALTAIYFINSITPSDVLNIGYDYQDELNNMKESIENGMTYKDFIKEHNSLVDFA